MNNNTNSIKDNRTKIDEYDKSTIFNIPNVLMFLRIALIPFLIITMVLAGNYSIPGIWGINQNLHESGNGNIKYRIIATIIFLIAALTDRYDGIYARKHKQITNIGKIGDPIADKLLTGSVMIALSIFANLPWVITILVFIREWAITILRLSILKKVVLPAGLGGKIKTNLQIFAILFYIFPFYYFPFMRNIPQILMVVACFWTLFTGIEYFIKINKINK